jgi:hypothetical protein
MELRMDDHRQKLTIVEIRPGNTHPDIHERQLCYPDTCVAGKEYHHRRLSWSSSSCAFTSSVIFYEYTKGGYYFG